MDELTTVIEAFTNADFDKNGTKDTIGIALDKTLYYSTRGIFNAFQAYPEIWEVKNGRVVWGGINESNKAALAYLNSLYRKGLIDKEFITYDEAGRFRALLSGKSGVFFGGHWSWLREKPRDQPTMEWSCPSPIPTPNGNPVRYPIVPTYTGWTAVNSKFSNPEIAYKLQSVANWFFGSKDSAWWWFEEGAISAALVQGNRSVPAMDNYNTYLNLMEAYAKNDPSVLRAKAITYWDNLHGYLQWGWETGFGPGPYTAMTVLDEAVKRNGLFYDSFVGVPSSYMKERWASILDRQLVTFTQIITGDLDVNAGFDAWVNAYNSMGGDRITREVNDWYKQTH
jgi:putative aldouronate transport system substrate-binding protein